jgi:hypothetical protein
MHSCPIVLIFIIFILGLSKWARTCSIQPLSLACVTQPYDLQLYPFSYKLHNFIFLYDWVKFHGHIYHIFFIHLSIVQLLSWFHSLAIVKRAAINVSVQLFLLHIDLCSFRIYPRGVLWCYKAGLFLGFWGTFILISIAVTQGYIPTSRLWGFFFPHILTSFYCCLFYWWLPL